MNGTLLRDLSLAFAMGQRDLLTIIQTAPLRYKVYDIPKRNGGTRTIAQPSRELKALQRYVLHTELSGCPIHPAAMAYVVRRNIRDNAVQHVGNAAILKLDFEGFFPSIIVRDWTRYVRRTGLPIAKEEADLYNRILFWGKGTRLPICLSIGAPTSPSVSNFVMFDLDSKIFEASQEGGVTYSRYADDITISGDTLEKVAAFEATVRKIVKASRSPQFTFNEEKRGVYTRGQRRMVTGVILTPDQKISIGRQRKRLISVMLHKVALDQADPVQRARLKGLLGFCISVEPDFVGRMRTKYGSAVVDAALTYHIPAISLPTPA
jgi:RNA-directed DNA polymerase